ncbi:MAG: FkbM family methyltransferase, partial [Planctomycetes bacterium]|nr:FkbM family methyltransferase [Planctomycetota bacterium]
PLVSEIEVINLSDLYKTYDIETCSLLKCDIEGAEHGVFDSIDDETVLRADRYYMELHARAGEDSARIDKITNRLKRLDYDVEVGERMDLGEGTPWAVMVYATKNSL